MRVSLSWIVFFAAVALILWSYAEPALKPVGRVVAFALLAITTVNMLRPRIRKWRGLPKA